MQGGENKGIAEYRRAGVRASRGDSERLNTEAEHKKAPPFLDRAGTPVY